MKPKPIFLIAAALLGALVPAASADHRPGHGGPNNITISASANTIKFGGSVTLSGRLNGANNAGRPVLIEEDPFPVDIFTPAGTVTTNASGDWSFADSPTVNTRYRARSGEADSRNEDVMVRPAISLRVSDRTPEVGQLVRFSGRLCPEHDGVRVALQRRVDRDTWTTVRRPLLRDIPDSSPACSSYARSLRMRRDRRFRVHFFGDVDHVEGNSRSRLVDVHR
jgi:hypothetical protein